MESLHSEVRHKAAELADLTGEELYNLRVKEDNLHQKKNAQHHQDTHNHWKQDAAIRFLLRQKCIDDTGEHDWMRHAHAYAEQFCKKCLVTRR